MKNEILKVQEHKFELPVIDGKQYFVIKPFCEVIGVDYSTQLIKIKDDEILNQLYSLTYTTGDDKKQYEMGCLPLLALPGWLFGISTSKVKEEAKEKLVTFKLECYEVLYDHFIGAKQFLADKEKSTKEQLAVVKSAKQDFTSAKTTLKEAEDKLYKISDLTFEEYKLQKAQLTIPFAE